jgi:hypothetical protein
MASKYKPKWWTDPFRTPPPADFVAAVDTREQDPFFRSDGGIPLLDGEEMAFHPWARRRTLPTGDYSLVGHEHEIVIERKSLPDLYQSVSKGRERFEREFERMYAITTPVLLVEASWSEIINPTRIRSQMNPLAVRNTIISWSVKHHVLFFPSGSRRQAEADCFTILAMWYREFLTHPGSDGTMELEDGQSSLLLTS